MASSSFVARYLQNDLFDSSIKERTAPPRGNHKLCAPAMIDENADVISLELANQVDLSIPQKKILVKAPSLFFIEKSKS
jgi:hypothetical protein